MVLGVLQIGFSGGEPLQRRDLEALVQSARDIGLYTSLVTSGLGLTQGRMRQLAESGLDNIQLSFQATEGENWLSESPEFATRMSKSSAQPR